MKLSEEVRNMGLGSGHASEKFTTVEEIKDIRAEWADRIELLEKQVAKLDKKKDHWRHVHERKVIELQLRYAERSSFDLLADHYKKWTEEQKLPSVSADEQNRMTTSEYEDAYLNRFIELWDMEQEESRNG
jgi:hypothetical protein